jgi:hypothetical protein
MKFLKCLYSPLLSFDELSLRVGCHDIIDNGLGFPQDTAQMIRSTEAFRMTFVSIP